MALSNTELAQKLDVVVTGWQGFTNEQIAWITGTGEVTVTDPYTLVEYQLKTPAQMQADYDSLLGPTGSQLAQVQTALDDANSLLTNAQALDGIYQGYVTDAQASEAGAEVAEAAAQLARDAAQVSETNAAASEAAAAVSETNAATSAAGLAPFIPNGGNPYLAQGSMLGIGRQPTVATLEVMDLAATTPKVRVIHADYLNDYIELGSYNGGGYLTRWEQAGDSVLNLDASVGDNTSDSEVAVNRFTDTTGAAAVKFYAGDNTATVVTEINRNSLQLSQGAKTADLFTNDSSLVQRSDRVWSVIIQVDSQDYVDLVPGVDIPSRGQIEFIGNDPVGDHYGQGIYDIPNDFEVWHWDPQGMQAAESGTPTYGSNQVRIGTVSGNLRVINDVGGSSTLAVRIFGVT